MKKISNLKGAKALSKTDQKTINGGFGWRPCGIPCRGNSQCVAYCDSRDVYVCFNGTCHSA